MPAPVLASRERPTGTAGRRQRLDDFGPVLGMPAHARLEPIELNGVPAEWSTTPQADVRTPCSTCTTADTWRDRSKPPLWRRRDRAAPRAPARSLSVTGARLAEMAALAGTAMEASFRQ
jgi:hypothetical protein